MHIYLLQRMISENEEFKIPTEAETLQTHCKLHYTNLMIYYENDYFFKLFFG